MRASRETLMAYQRPLEHFVRIVPRAEIVCDPSVVRTENLLRRRAPKRPQLNNTDRFLFVWLYHWFPSVLGAIAIVRPETIIRWHRAGFRAYWRWRSRNHVGRPKISAELRTLIGEMSRANPHCQCCRFSDLLSMTP